MTLIVASMLVAAITTLTAMALNALRPAMVEAQAMSEEARMEARRLQRRS